jgi:hypothetical protein
LNKLNIKSIPVPFILHYYSIFTVKLVSWNIQNFGKSKSEVEINFIANTLKLRHYCHTGSRSWLWWRTSSSQTDELNRKGSKWDYVISDPTSSSA